MTLTAEAAAAVRCQHAQVRWAGCQPLVVDRLDGAVLRADEHGGRSHAAFSRCADLLAKAHAAMRAAHVEEHLVVEHRENERVAGWPPSPGMDHMREARSNSSGRAKRISLLRVAVRMNRCNTRAARRGRYSSSRMNSGKSSQGSAPHTMDCKASASNWDLVQISLPAESRTLIVAKYDDPRRSTGCSSSSPLTCQTISGIELSTKIAAASACRTWVYRQFRMKGPTSSSQQPLIGPDNLPTTPSCVVARVNIPHSCRSRGHRPVLHAPAGVQ